MVDSNYSPPEARYGIPTADQILFNRGFTVGYSYKLKQPKWVLELIDSKSLEVDIEGRNDIFRPDYRIPENFRVDENHYKGSGYDRGHLIASSNKLSSEISNSETFLMSNMSPQLPTLNRGIWKSLESYVGKLKNKKNVLEVYCISGPLWNYGKTVEPLDGGLEYNTLIPIPHLFFKCILAEYKSGLFKFYAFMIPNDISIKNKNLKDFQVVTSEVENFAGLLMWSNLKGKSIIDKKSKKYSLWS